MELSGILNKLDFLFGTKNAPREKKPSVVKELLDQPEEFKLEAYIDGGEITIKIKKREKQESLMGFTTPVNERITPVSGYHADGLLSARAISDLRQTYPLKTRKKQ